METVSARTSMLSGQSRSLNAYPGTTPAFYRTNPWGSDRSFLTARARSNKGSRCSFADNSRQCFGLQRASPSDAPFEHTMIWLLDQSQAGAVRKTPLADDRDAFGLFITRHITSGRRYQHWACTKAKPLFHNGCWWQQKWECRCVLMHPRPTAWQPWSRSKVRRRVEKIPLHSASLFSLWASEWWRGGKVCGFLYLHELHSGFKRRLLCSQMFIGMSSNFKRK